MRVWYRGITQLLFTQGPPEALTAQQSTAAKLPLEVVEMIIAHLIHDKRSLLACSLTCYSWYIASVPHLHHTRFIRSDPGSESKHRWPTPLKNSSKLGLLPFVKKLRIRRITFASIPFSPKKISSRTLRQISEMRNIQQLEIDDLEIPKFMPRVRHYFGHFLPMLRSLGLKAPRGSRREIIFFIGLFQHLEDLTLLDDALKGGLRADPVNDLTLVPPSAPPLRGRLVMSHFRREGFFKDMVDLFGGVRFSYVDIFDVGETRHLLEACAKTLETVRFYPSDPYGEQL